MEGCVGRLPFFSFMAFWPYKKISPDEIEMSKFWTKFNGYSYKDLKENKVFI